MRKSPRVIPGFGLSLGYTVTYLSLVVLIPLATLFAKSAQIGWSGVWETVTSPYVLGAYRMSLGSSLVAAFANVFIGLLVAWVLGRYAFPGKRLVDALVDLPFALPTAVAGIALTTLYSERGWVGAWLKKVGFRYPWPEWRGFGGGHWFPLELRTYADVAMAPLGVTLALMFVTLPFVVRTVQPIIEDMGRDTEEAAASLGANRRQTVWRIVLPQLWPALVTGFALAFARALGEYGSVIFITGNRPGMAIAPQEVISRLEQYRYEEAAAIAAVLLVISFVLLLVINVLQRKMGAGR